MPTMYTVRPLEWEKKSDYEQYEARAPGGEHYAVWQTQLSDWATSVDLARHLSKEQAIDYVRGHHESKIIPHLKVAGSVNEVRMTAEGIEEKWVAAKVPVRTPEEAARFAMRAYGYDGPKLMSGDVAGVANEIAQLMRDLK